jgi:hypothetical protein
MMHEQFLREIEDFLTEQDMSPSRFGLLALNDREFVRRLRRGSDVRTRTVEKVKQFMDQERARTHVAA